jgi:hypothetical protein
MAIEIMRNLIKPLLCALIPAFLWACAISLIGRGPGFHSTAGIWAMLIGFPGVCVGSWIGFVTSSQTAVFAGMFLGNWFFWFAVIEVFLVLRRKWG